MKLFKNVNICDLSKILRHGIMSIDDLKKAGISSLGVDQWADYGAHRAPNSTSAVYLFKPLTRVNSFDGYGTVLLEVEVEDAVEQAFLFGDVNEGKYIEYVVPFVPADKIVNIYAPKVHKASFEKLSNPYDMAYHKFCPDDLNRITYVDIEGELWDRAIMNYRPFTQDDLNKLDMRGTGCIGGVDKDRIVVDFRNIHYVI